MRISTSAMCHQQTDTETGLVCETTLTWLVRCGPLDVTATSMIFPLFDGT